MVIQHASCPTANTKSKTVLGVTLYVMRRLIFHFQITAGSIAPNSNDAAVRIDLAGQSRAQVGVNH
jgi:hypothetical protein